MCFGKPTAGFGGGAGKPFWEGKITTPTADYSNQPRVPTADFSKEEWIAKQVDDAVFADAEKRKEFEKNAMAAGRQLTPPPDQARAYLNAIRRAAIDKRIRQSGGGFFSGAAAPRRGPERPNYGSLPEPPTKKKGYKRGFGTPGRSGGWLAPRPFDRGVLGGF